MDLDIKNLKRLINGSGLKGLKDCQKRSSLLILGSLFNTTMGIRTDKKKHILTAYATLKFDSTL